MNLDWHISVSYNPNKQMTNRPTRPNQTKPKQTKLNQTNQPTNQLTNQLHGAESFLRS